MEIINTLLGLDWIAIATAVLVIIGGASVLATVTPNESDDRVIQSVQNWINRFALLVGKARVK